MPAPKRSAPKSATSPTPGDPKPKPSNARVNRPGQPVRPNWSGGQTGRPTKPVTRPGSYVPTPHEAAVAVPEGFTQDPGRQKPTSVRVPKSKSFDPRTGPSNYRTGEKSPPVKKAAPKPKSRSNNRIRTTSVSPRDVPDWLKERGRPTGKVSPTRNSTAQVSVNEPVVKAAETRAGGGRVKGGPGFRGLPKGRGNRSSSTWSRGRGGGRGSGND